MADALAAEQRAWGVDLGLTATTICAVRPGRKPVWVQVSAGTTGSITERLAVLDRELQREALELAVECPPACVMIEQPIRRFPNPHLDWACGVVSLGLHLALSELEEGAPPIWHCPVSAWKKSTVGKGSATKAEVQEWARLVKHADVDPDRADALGIATHTLNALEVLR